MTLRRWRLLSGAVAACLGASLVVPSAQAAPEDTVEFSNQALLRCVQWALGLDESQDVTRDDLASLTTLECVNINLAGIEPLSYATGLSTLSLPDSYTSNYESVSLAPLADLTELESLTLTRARGIDWDVLAPLTSLETVDLTDSNVSDIAWLSGASDLRDVRLNSTRVSDLTALEGKPLERLELDYTDATDLDWLATTPGLEHVSLRWLGLQHIDFLTGLEELTFVNINSNEVSDLQPLQSSAGLVTLEFAGNHVDDVAVLAAFPALREVDLTGNHVTDISVLAGLANLEDWSAYAQEATLPDITACEIQVAHAGVNIDGTALNLAPRRGAGDADTFVVGIDGEVEIKASAPGYPFSVTYVAEVVGYSQPCAWPTEYLSTMKFPSELVARTLATIEIAEWGTRHEEPLYRWTLEDGTVDAITKTVLPLPSGIGTTVTPSAVWYVDGMEKVTVTGSPLTIYGTHPADATWSFSGPPTVGDGAHLQSDQSWSSISLTCEWLLDGVTVTTSANCAWVIPSSAAGKQLSGRVTVHRANYKDATYEVPAATVVRPFAKSYAGHVVGTPDVGNTLSLAPLDTDAWSPLPTSRTYQWLRGGVPIAGATSGTYTLQTADAGKVISVEVTGRRAGYRSVTIETRAFPVHRLFTSTPTPTISGTRAVGFTLTVSRGTWSPTPSSYVYRWYRDGIAISGATKSSYKATTADGGHKITVKVWAKRSGYTTTSRTSDAVTVLKVLTSKPTPTISGTAKVKSTLTARTGTWGPGTVTKSYQWYRNGKAIAGATKSTYKVSVKDAYAKITVKVTGTKSGYAKSSRTSASKTPVGIKYSSCTSLRKDYPGGVAKSSSTKGIRSTTYVSSSLYSLNSSRDADKDGWACE